MNIEIVQLKNSIIDIFGQVQAVILQLSDEEYEKKGALLLNASIGQHVRHMIELFTELGIGYESGTVNYENRKRDHNIETNRELASGILREIAANLEKENKDLQLQACFSNKEKMPLFIQTNYYRELAYNIEHSIHHMALIRIGINALRNVKIDDTFGVASATVKYRNSCVQ
jgi:uncharacterized damage-inducible protein DinB